MITNIFSQIGRAARLPQTFRQVRYRRKTFQLEFRYGAVPIFTDIEKLESDQLQDLSFQTVRFARIWENNSLFFDQLYDKYLRHIMRDGRRWLMDELLHNTFYEIKIIQFNRLRKLKEKQQRNDPLGEQEETIETNPLDLFKKAIENCKPMVITRKVKRGGAIYQVPYPLSSQQSEWYAMRWLNDTVKDRPKPRKKHYHEVLAQEIIDAANGQGKVVKKKEDLHRLAQANKAYAHYRWG